MSLGGGTQLRVFSARVCFGVENVLAPRGFAVRRRVFGTCSWQARANRRHGLPAEKTAVTRGEKMV